MTDIPLVRRDTLTTKGDLFVRDATTVVRLPIGADGQVPVVDSGEAAGIGWGDLPAFGVIPVSTQTASYIADLDDVGTVVRMNDDAALDFTIEAEADTAWPEGAVIGVRQIDATVTLVEDAGVTITPPDGSTLVLARAGAEVSLHYIGSDVWEVVGDLEPTA